MESEEKDAVTLPLIEEAAAPAEEIATQPIVTDWAVKAIEATSPDYDPTKPHSFENRDPKDNRSGCQISFKKLHEAAQLPTYSTPGSAGMDVRSVVQVLIHPGDRVAVPTGLAVALPMGMEIQVRPRSGLAFKQGLTVFNAPGTIDSDYRGEIKVLLINLSDQVQTIAVGDRIAQLVIGTYIMADPAVFVDDLGETVRGDGGFGSTGVK